MCKLRYLVIHSIPTHLKRAGSKTRACWKMSLCTKPNTQTYKIRLHLSFSKHPHKPIQSWVGVVMPDILFSQNSGDECPFSCFSSLIGQLQRSKDTFKAVCLSLISRLNHWKGFLQETVNALVFVQRAHKPQTYLTYPGWLFSLRPSVYFPAEFSLSNPHPHLLAVHLSSPLVRFALHQ